MRTDQKSAPEQHAVKPISGKQAAGGNVGLFARQSLFVVFSRGFFITIGLAKAAIIARMLGPANRGVYSLFCTVPELVVALGNLGYGTSLLYYIAKKRTDMRIATGGAFLYLALCGGLLTIVAAVLLRILPQIHENINQVQPYSRLLLISAPLVLSYTIGIKLLQGKSRIYKVSWLQVVHSSAPLLLFFLMLRFFSAPLDAAIWAWTFGLMGSSIVPFILIRDDGAYPPRFEPRMFSQSLRYGLAGYASTWFEMAMFRLDHIIIAANLGAEPLGYYSVSSRLAEILLIAPKAVIVPFIPFLFGMQTGESKIFTPRVLKLTLFSMIIISLIVSMAAPLIIRLLFGEAFFPATGPLRLLLPGIVGSSLFLFLRIEIYGRGKPKLTALVTGMSFLIHLVALLITLPLFGIHGAAASSSLGYILAACGLAAVYKKLSGNSFSSTYLLSLRECSEIASSILLYIKKKLPGASP